MPWEKIQAKFDKSDQIVDQLEEELMDFIEQQQQEQEQIEEEVVTPNSKTPYLSEDTEVINEISFKIPSKLFIPEITTSFDKNVYRLSLNNIFEAATFEPEPTFEKTINEIKKITWKVSPPLPWIYQL